MFVRSHAETWPRQWKYVFPSRSTCEQERSVQKTVAVETHHNGSVYINNE